MEQFVRPDFADDAHDADHLTDSSPDHQPAYSENLNITICMA